MNSAIEYYSPEGILYRMEHGLELMEMFSIAGSDAEKQAALTIWHQELSTTGETWLVVSRLHGIARVVGETEPDAMRPWAVGELARCIDCSPGEIQEILETAVKFWARIVEAKQRGASVVEVDKTEADVGSEVIDKRLEQYGFLADETVSAAEKRFIYDRIDDLGEVIDDRKLRSSALSMIRSEVNIFFGLDVAIATVRGEISEAKNKAKMAHADEKDKTKPLLLEKRLADLMASRQNAQRAVEDTMGRLGITDLQASGLQNRVTLRSDLAFVVQGVMEYEAVNDNTKIDGMFRKAEIDVLTRKFNLRRRQYPVLAVLMMPPSIEEMFNPDYKQPEVTRAIARRLLAGFERGLAAAMSDENVETGELDEDMRKQAVEEAALAQPQTKQLPGAVTPNIDPGNAKPVPQNFAPSSMLADGVD